MAYKKEIVLFRIRRILDKDTITNENRTNYQVLFYDFLDQDQPVFPTTEENDSWDLLVANRADISPTSLNSPKKIIDKTIEMLENYPVLTVIRYMERNFFLSL